MSRPRGGYIGFNRVPAASAINSAASGVWTLREAEALKRAGTWPIAPAVPGAPTGLAASAGNAQLSLSWTAPASNGGIAITGYRVQYTPSGGSASTVDTGSTGTTYTLTGLTNGTSYTVSVAAINGVGVGSYSSTVTGTPVSASVPGAPRSVSFLAGPCGQGTISWLAPLSDGGSAITGYRLRSSLNGFSTTYSTSGTTTGQVSGAALSLRGSNTWTARVWAVNSIGESSSYAEYVMADDNNSGFASGCG